VPNVQKLTTMSYLASLKKCVVSKNEETTCFSLWQKQETAGTAVAGQRLISHHISPLSLIKREHRCRVSCVMQSLGHLAYCQLASFD